MSIARTLSRLAVNTTTDTLPQQTYDDAARMLLDTCACAFAGMQAPGIAELVALEAELSATGPGSVYFTDQKLSLPSAAFCNAAMVHAMDFDNNYPGADIHILSIVVPVALACCEAQGANGRQCLSGIILGVETAARIAKPYMRAERPHAWFLTTSLVGGWGGVATAARLLGLTVGQTVHAMGIYYAHTGGNRQALLEKALSKRIQPAIAARAAVYSVLLARRGITGPEHVFEGTAGFYRCYTEGPPPPENTFNTSVMNAVSELVVKQFPTCGIHHANIISALQLKREHRFSTDDIERVEFFLREGGNTLVSMPYDPGPNPQVAAQFCAPYAIALALHKGAVSIRDFEPGQILDNRATADLARRTKEITRFKNMTLQRYTDAAPGCHYTKVILRNGDVLEHESRGDTLNHPELFGIREVSGKFRDCVSMYGETDNDTTEQMIGTVLGIEDAGNMRSFVAAIFGPHPGCEVRQNP